MNWEEFLNENIESSYNGQVRTDITCPKCGRNVEPGTKFCPECGKKVE